MENVNIQENSNGLCKKYIIENTIFCAKIEEKRKTDLLKNIIISNNESNIKINIIQLKKINQQLMKFL